LDLRQKLNQLKQQVTDRASSWAAVGVNELNYDFFCLALGWVANLKFEYDLVGVTQLLLQLVEAGRVE